MRRGEVRKSPMKPLVAACHTETGGFESHHRHHRELVRGYGKVVRQGMRLIVTTGGAFGCAVIGISCGKAEDSSFSGSRRARRAVQSTSRRGSSGRQKVFVPRLVSDI